MPDDKRAEQAKESIDWRSILVRYVRAVMEDDICVGPRCLTEPLWCPQWTDAERQAVELIKQEAAGDMFGEGVKP